MIPNILKMEGQWDSRLWLVELLIFSCWQLTQQDMCTYNKKNCLSHQALVRPLS